MKSGTGFVSTDSTPLSPSATAGQHRLRVQGQWLLDFLLCPDVVPPRCGEVLDMPKRECIEKEMNR